MEIKLSTSIDKTENDRNKIQNIKLNILNKEDEFYRLCHDIQENYITINNQKLLINHNNYSTAIRDWKSRNKRKEIYQLFYSNYDIRLNVLQSLREYRHELALNIGYNSFSNLKSQTSLFKGDLNKINGLLLNINKSIEIKCKNEISQLIKYNDNYGLTLYDIAFAKKQSKLNDDDKNNNDKQFIRIISQLFNN